ncbi:MAG TPA: hypothetical protein VIQ97_05215, partial [Prevotella sp.]
MKKSIIVSTVALLLAVQAHACGPMRPVHNYYMFSIFNASYYGMSFEDRIIEFWKRYTYEKRSPQQLMQSNSGVCTFSDLFFG